MASLTRSALTSSTSQVMFCAVTQPSAHPFQHAMQTQATAARYMPHWLRQLHARQSDAKPSSHQ